MTLREIARALKAEFPKEYSNFSINVNVYPRTIVPDSRIEMEIYIYTPKQGFVHGTSFEECLDKIRALRKPLTVTSALDQEIPTTGHCTGEKCLKCNGQGTCGSKVDQEA